MSRAAAISRAGWCLRAESSPGSNCRAIEGERTYGFESSRDPDLHAFHRLVAGSAVLALLRRHRSLPHGRLRRSSTPCGAPISCCCSAASCAGCRARAASYSRASAVPICRAAFGALEKLLCAPLYFAMEKHSDIGEHAHQRRAWRWAREIAIAIVLTIAAAAFITAALLRGNGEPDTTPSFETARKPSCAIAQAGVSAARQLQRWLADDAAHYGCGDAERDDLRHGRRISARVDEADEIGTRAIGVAEADRETIRVTPDDRSRHAQAAEADGYEWHQAPQAGRRRSRAPPSETSRMR